MKKLLLALAMGCMMLPITSQAETILVGTDAGYAHYEFKELILLLLSQKPLVTKQKFRICSLQGSFRHCKAI